MFFKNLGEKLYEIDDSACVCGSDDVVYNIIEKVGEKLWDSVRKCEFILDTTIKSAECVKCHCNFPVKLSTANAYTATDSKNPSPKFTE